MIQNSVSAESSLILFLRLRVESVCIRQLSVCCCWFFFGGGSMRRSQNLEEKELHTALYSVQFLASFISFYSEILSYLAFM